MAGAVASLLPGGRCAPVKRHPALQDLSRDHFTALNRSLQVARAVQGHPTAWPFPHAFAAFRALWDRDGLPAHFLEEETDLVPLLRAHGAAALADRLLDEHATLRTGFHGLDAHKPEQAAGVAEGLRAHARWEEDVVFPWLQDNLSEAQLQDLLARSRSFRGANALPIGPGAPAAAPSDAAGPGTDPPGSAHLT